MVHVLMLNWDSDKLNHAFYYTMYYKSKAIHKEINET